MEKRITNPAGRPKMDESIKKRHMTISVTPKEQKIIKELAAGYNMTISDLLTAYAMNDYQNLAIKAEKERKKAEREAKAAAKAKEA